MSYPGAGVCIGVRIGVRIGVCIGGMHRGCGSGYASRVRIRGYASDTHKVMNLSVKLSKGYFGTLSLFLPLSTCGISLSLSLFLSLPLRGTTSLLRHRGSTTAAAPIPSALSTNSKNMLQKKLTFVMQIFDILF